MFGGKAFLSAACLLAIDSPLSSGTKFYSPIPMIRNLIWKGIEYQSLENCRVDFSRKGAVVNSVIVGLYQNIIYRMEYQIATDPGWNTRSCIIKARINKKQLDFIFESDGKGNWQKNGRPLKAFKGCTDVDIAITPFTNSLPIHRLKLRNGQNHEIKVVYFDLLEQRIRPVKQSYTRLSKTSYHYENVPNDFEADIRVDENGLVVYYPELFEREATGNF